jgi:hypothetical protein
MHPAQLFVDNGLLFETNLNCNNRYKLNKDHFQYISEIIYNFPVYHINQYSNNLCNLLVEDNEQLISEESLPKNRRITFLNDDDRTTLCFFHRDLVDYLHNSTN